MSWTPSSPARMENPPKPKKLKWSIIEPGHNAPNHRSNHEAVALGHHIIIYGGDTHRHQNNEWSPCVNETFEFDTMASEWRDLSKIESAYPMMSPRGGPSSEAGGVPKDGFPALTTYGRSLVVFRACKLYTFFTGLGPAYPYPFPPYPPAYISTALRMYDMSTRKVLTDVNLHVVGGYIPAHQLILKLRCDKLLANTSILQGVTQDIVNEIMKYLYMGIVDFTLDWSKLVNIATVAKMLDLDDLVKKCENRVCRKIAHWNVIPIFKAAEAGLLPNIQYNCEEYLEANRADLRKYPQYAAFFEANPGTGGRSHRHTHPWKHPYVEELEDTGYTTIREMFRRLLEEDLYADMVFQTAQYEKADDSQAVRTHQVVLGAVSSYFHDVIMSTAKRARAEDGSLVTYSDYAPAQIRTFLRHVYMGELVLPSEGSSDPKQQSDVIVSLSQTFQYEALVHEIQWAMILDDPLQSPHLRPARDRAISGGSATLRPPRLNISSLSPRPTDGGDDDVIVPGMAKAEISPRKGGISPRPTLEPPVSLRSRAGSASTPVLLSAGGSTGIGSGSGRDRSDRERDRSERERERAERQERRERERSRDRERDREGGISPRGGMSTSGGISPRKGDISPRGGGTMTSSSETVPTLSIPVSRSRGLSAGSSSAPRPLHDTR
eukprot:TRINITY_DN3588_c0_g1_i5.p1 TRINITY_DN3588_c0_g1~~TRINITY_DN3588_c0_g1_i5.p1  ORF type:complete len:663 (-),score=49.03 TRINITY_DN3588_c0_g1_i5:126-2114(-)